MFRKNAITLAALVIITAGCSGGNEGNPAAGLLSHIPAASTPQSICAAGSVVFAPVTPLVCDSLPAAPSAPDVDLLPGGYWTGQFLDETQDVQGYIAAMVSEDGRFQLQAFRFNDNNLCYNWEAALAGDMTTDGNTLDGGGRLIAVSPTLVDGTRAADLHIEGWLEERSSMIGKWSAASGDAGCYELSYYDYVYDAPSALANVVGNWSGHGSNPGAGLHVATDGALNGSDGYGCNLSGYLGLIDDRYSLYEFDADVTSCLQAGHYAGLAWQGPGWDSGEFWLQIRANDDARVLALNFTNR